MRKVVLMRDVVVNNKGKISPPESKGSVTDECSIEHINELLTVVYANTLRGGASNAVS